MTESFEISCHSFYIISFSTSIHTSLEIQDSLLNYIDEDIKKLWNLLWMGFCHMVNLTVFITISKDQIHDKKN